MKNSELEKLLAQRKEIDRQIKALQSLELHFIEESELQKYLDVGYVKGMKIKE